MIAQRVLILVFLILLSIPFFDSFFLLCYLFFSFHTWNGRKKTKEMSIKLPVYSERPRWFFLHFLTEKKTTQNKQTSLPDHTWTQWGILIFTLTLSSVWKHFLLKRSSMDHERKWGRDLLEKEEKKTFNFQLIFHSFFSSFSLSPNRLPFNNKKMRLYFSGAAS